MLFHLGDYFSFSWVIVAILRQSVLLETSVFFLCYHGREGLGVALPRGLVPLL